MDSQSDLSETEECCGPSSGQEAAATATLWMHSCRRLWLRAFTCVHSGLKTLETGASLCRERHPLLSLYREQMFYGAVAEVLFSMHSVFYEEDI